jgi:hypothetical protein
MVRHEGIPTVRRFTMTSTLPHLPSDFYDYSEPFRRVRQAAFSRQVSPDAVLAVTLCRVAASLPPGIALPENGSLNFVAALVGAPGTGKTKAMRCATDLLPDIGTRNDGLPIGSGEGIASAYVGKADESGTNPMVNTSALFHVDEGSRLMTLGKREGSTVFDTIRECWSGSTIGSMNASLDRRRIVKAGTYRFALAVGFQPVFAAELLNESVAGDPQRYLFAGVTHPDITDRPIPFPDPIHLVKTGTIGSTVLNVDAGVVAGIRKRRAAVGRGDIVANVYDAHRDLLTLKVAALLSYLDGSGDVTADLWELAGYVVGNGQNVQQHLASSTQADRLERERERIALDVMRDTMRDDSRRERVRNSMAKSMIRKARSEGKPVTKSTLITAVAGKHREFVPVDEVIDYACEHETDDGRLTRNGDYFAYVPAA